MSPLIHVLLEMPAQDPVGGLWQLLDKGPLGLAAVLMVAIGWLYKSEKAEKAKMREEQATQNAAIRAEQKEDRQENKQLLREATAAVSENTAMMNRVVSLVEGNS